MKTEHRLKARFLGALKAFSFFTVLFFAVSAQAETKLQAGPGFEDCGLMLRVAYSNLSSQVNAGWITQQQADAELNRLAEQCESTPESCESCNDAYKNLKTLACQIKQKCGSRCRNMLECN